MTKAGFELAIAVLVASTPGLLQAHICMEYSLTGRIINHRGTSLNRLDTKRYPTLAFHYKSQGYTNTGVHLRRWLESVNRMLYNP
jgi:hypothetical protein